MAAKITDGEQKMLTFEKKVFHYLGDYGWTPLDIGISLMVFEETHGAEAVAAMRRFVEKMEAEGKAGIVAMTLGHDLKGARDALMHPRTSGY